MNVALDVAITWVKRDGVLCRGEVMLENSKRKLIIPFSARRQGGFYHMFVLGRLCLLEGRTVDGIPYTSSELHMMYSISKQLIPFITEVYEKPIKRQMMFEVEYNN